MAKMSLELLCDESRSFQRPVEGNSEVFLVESQKMGQIQVYKAFRDLIQYFVETPVASAF